MKQHGGRWRIFLGLASSVLVLAACGGGGGGGGGGGPVVPTSYTGLTTQAVITSANGVTLVGGAWEGGMVTDSVAGVVPLAIQANPQSPAAMYGFANHLKSLVLQVVPTGRAQAQPAVVVTEDLPFDCGGNASFTMDLNDVSGVFTGQFTFNSYCTQGTVISGVLSFSGQANPADGFVSQLQLVFNNLMISDPTFSGTITEGTVDFTFATDGLSEVDTLDYVLRDNLNLKTYWVDNYVAQITYGPVNDEVLLTGRYYDPDLGYVDISTLSPLLISLNPMPNGGILLFSGQASQARLSFTPGQTNLLEIDGNNDGLFETSILNPL